MSGIPLFILTVKFGVGICGYASTWEYATMLFQTFSTGTFTWSLLTRG